ncbi:MAG: murein biosynthesis integral membrane protein MurJ [Anaerovoracaceae bacterium]|jgi:putative peptidoglycan lipid II flippase
MRAAAKTAAMMAVLTLGMKVLGFLREVFMAGFFGTSYIVDSYVMASAIPGIMFAGIFTSVAVSYMPIFSRIVEDRGMEEGNRFTSEAITLTSFIALIAAILGIVFSEQVVSIFARGFVGETAALTVFYLRITFSYLVFTSATSLLESYLQYKGTFLKPVLTGYLQSGFVLLAIIISAYYSHYFLAFGLLIGSILRLIALALVAKSRGFSYRPTRHVGSAAKEITVLAVPVFIGSTVNQINSFVDKMLASGLEEGSVSALNYGYLLINMITALTITVIVTIIYPRLTQSLAAEDYTRFNDSIGTGMNIILIIGLPCSLGAMLYSHPAVQLVYERGVFDSASTDLTAGAFFYYAVGLTFIAVNALLVKVFYSMQDMKTPVVCGVFGAVTNIVLNLMLVGSMAHRGLALATSIAAVVNAGLLYFWMRKKYPKVQVIRERAKIWKITLSAIVCVGISWPVYKGIGAIAASSTALSSTITTLLSLFCAVAAAAAVYLILLRLFRIQELSLLRDLIK